MLNYFFILYLILARFFKIWSRKVQIHSIVHCVTSFLITSFVLFVSTGNSPFDINVRDILVNVSPDREWLFKFIIFHSLGYFLADTVDIFIDYTNIKRRVYLLHHIAAIAGLSTVYWGSYMSVYPIWALEIGGIVHHLKHASEVYSFGPILYFLTHVLYHVIYLFSRVLLALNVYVGFTWICHSDNIHADIVGLLIACILIIQNFLWWIHNIKKIFGYSE